VPKSAPNMKGIAFLRFINLATASGTNNPIVILEENTSAVTNRPIKYVLYFDLK